MKKLMLFFLLFTSAILVNGQVWIDQGACWHYQYYGLTNGGFIKINYSKDTIISNRTCQQLLPVKYVFFADSSHVVYFGGKYNLKTEYTSVSGDTVFYLLNNQFQILYNFNAIAGDSWNLGTDTNNFLCSKSTVIVDSTGSMIINNHNYRWMDVHSSPNSSKVLQGRIIERFGAASAYLFPIDNFCDSNVVVDADQISFLCYKDTTFGLYNPSNLDCEPYLDIETLDIPSQNITIYPNPANDVICITQYGNKINEIRVLNLQGQEIISQNFNRSDDRITLAINKLSKGIYFIQLTTAKGLVNKKFVVIR